LNLTMFPSLVASVLDEYDHSCTSNVYLNMNDLGVHA